MLEILDRFLFPTKMTTEENDNNNNKKIRVIYINENQKKKNFGCIT